MSNPNNTEKSQFKASSIAVLISGLFVFGGFVQNGVIGFSDGSNIYQTLVPIAIMFYLLILLGLSLAGFKLKKHEMIVISLVLTIILFSFFNLALKPNFKVKDSTGGDQSDEDLITRTSTQVSSEASTGSTFSVTITSNQLSQEQEIVGVFLTQFQLFIISITLVLMIFILIFVYSRSLGNKINIRFVDEQTYKGEYTEHQSSIIRIYTTTSFKLEKQFGRAPNWYSPTHFSDEISKRTIVSLASSWESLTGLYEQARFGRKAVTSEDVENALDLMAQIDGLLERLRKEMEAK